MDWLKGFSLGATLCINDSLLHMVRNMSIFKPDIMLMVPMMIDTIYKRLAAADPSIPKAVLAEKVFGGKLRIIFTGGAHPVSYTHLQTTDLRKCFRLYYQTVFQRKSYRTAFIVYVRLISFHYYSGL